MVNIKRIGSGILGAGAVLFVAAGAEAGLPTFDAANIAGTMSIVKNGSQNLKGIGDITNKVGELNTIVGDAAASVSKFQEQYGDEINKGMEMAQKAMARKAEAEAAKAAHDAEVQAQKDAYQAAMDSVAEISRLRSRKKNITKKLKKRSSTHRKKRQPSLKARPRTSTGKMLKKTAFLPR